MPANGHDLHRTDEEVIEALFRTGGNIKETAAILKLASITDLRKRVNKSPELREARLEASEQMLDVAEKVVKDGLTKGTLKSKLETAKWYLPRKGRGRGYGDVSTNINANLNANYDFSKMSLEERMKLLETINGARTDTDND